MQTHEQHARPHTSRRRFFVTVAMLAIVWLVVLPWIATRPELASQIRQLDEQGIDPSAMYYTELEAMTPILKRLIERERAELKRKQAEK